jgi:5'-nucleotidase
MEEFTGKTSRRIFLGILAKASLIAGSGLLQTEILEARDIRKITILHTNDTHSRIDPFPENDPKYGGMGGVARRSSLIERIRESEPNVLLLDSGDIFQGTPYFNLYAGRPEFECMSAMRYDAATMGNHDFDNGLEGFKKMLPYANFPFLCANYDFSNTILIGKTQEYKIFEKQGIKIGVFGLGIELNGLVDKKQYQDTMYLDALEVAKRTSTKLKKDLGCDYVICLSHLGFKYESKSKLSDNILAQETEHIDLILGGHTHTFLDEPVKLMNKINKLVLVAQAGFAGIRLGRIDIFFNEKSKNIFSSGAHVNIFKKTS